jgi:hypothetical protein
MVILGPSNVVTAIAITPTATVSLSRERSATSSAPYARALGCR